MAQEVQLALQLQRMDRQLTQLEAEIRGLPKKIAVMESQLAARQNQLEAEQTAFEAKQSETKRVQTANEDHGLKLEKLKQQLMQATTPEQLTAFNHEIAYLEGEIKRGVANLSKLTADTELLRTKATDTEAGLIAESLSVDSLKTNATQLSEEDRKKGVKIYRQRQQLAKELPPQLLKDYERIKKKHKDGVVVAECTEGLCTACQMNIRAALLQQIRQNPEKMFFCESCLRILSYNPPRSIEGIPSSVQLSS